MSKFLLLLGPSGVGKSTIIRELTKLDERFTYISPYMTRPLRPGEKDKIPVTDKEIDNMEKEGELLAVNKLYNICYATPKTPIIEALRKQLFPVLDWPICKIQIMLEAFPGRLYCVYVFPPSSEILEKRIKKDGRDVDGSRLKNASLELSEFFSHKYSNLYDLSISSEDDKLQYVVETIYSSYLKSFL